MDGMEWNCVRDGCKASPLLSNSDNPTKPEVFGLQNNKKKSITGPKWGVLDGQDKAGIAAAEGGEQPGAQQWEHSPAVCAPRSLLCLFGVSTTRAPVLQTLPSLTGLVSLVQLKAAVALWGHLGDLLTPDPAALMWPQSGALAASSGATGIPSTSHSDHKRAAGHSSFRQTHCHTYRKKTNSSYFPHIFFFP